MIHSHISGESLLHRFSKEINLARKANHACSSAYVCHFYGACSIDGLPCLVMKRYTCTLTDYILLRPGAACSLSLIW